MFRGVRLGTGLKAAVGGQPQTTTTQDPCQHRVQLVWSEKSRWQQARGRSEVYLHANPALLVLWTSGAVQVLGGTAAGKLLHQLCCLPQTHHPRAGLLPGDVSFAPQASLASTAAGKDLTPDQAWHGVGGAGQQDALLLLGSPARTGLPKTLHCGLLAMSQLERTRWRSKSGGLTAETQCRNTNAQHQNSALLLRLHCSKAFDLLILFTPEAKSH